VDFVYSRLVLQHIHPRYVRQYLAEFVRVLRNDGVLVFQLPTLAFFLAKMGLVTAALLWRKIKYAILAIFIVAAVLTPSPDPWNQAIFAVPMIGLYLISIAIAWIVGPKRDPEAAAGGASSGLRLVIGAMVMDQAMTRRRAPATRSGI